MGNRNEEDPYWFDRRFNAEAKKKRVKDVRRKNENEFPNLYVEWNQNEAQEN